MRVQTEKRKKQIVRRIPALAFALLWLLTSVCGAGVPRTDGLPGAGTGFAQLFQTGFFGDEARTVNALPLSVPADTDTEKRLYPGGMLFGVRCATEGVLVAGLENVSGSACPARDAGICAGDVIREADGQEVTSVRALADRFASDTDGRAVSLTVLRNGTTETLSVTPVRAADGVMRAGIRLRDNAAGIGTVTFIDPETNLFGGLGHGICDADTGVLLPLSRGTTLGVDICEIVRGSAGAPGELRGCLTPKRTGALAQNTECGVFGLFSDLPAGTAAEPLPVGAPEEVHEGDAALICTLDDTGPKSYAIKIVRLTHDASSPTKNFVVEVTDPALLSKTGGIVQGMSGSPVIQDGKLIGAVTHVLVSDPARGFGIFLDNMTRAASFGQTSEDAA